MRLGSDSRFVAVVVAEQQWRPVPELEPKWLGRELGPQQVAEAAVVVVAAG